MMLAALTLLSLSIIIPAHASDAWKSFEPETYTYTGEGCGVEDLSALEPVETLEDCTVCHFVQNKAPCLNTYQNIYAQRFALFGGKWKRCQGMNDPETGTTVYPCEEYAEKTKTTKNKLFVRDTADGFKEYYVPGHYDFFQLKDPTNKRDPIVAGPNGELYCPGLPDGRDLSTIDDLDIGSDPATDYGCIFNFQRGICYTPSTTTQTLLDTPAQRSYKDGSCGPICPVTGRPWFPSKVLLTVCHDMEKQACCFPNQDTEIEEFYYDFLTAGDRCKEELIPAKKALRRIFCMACHKDAGKYIVDGTIKICKSLALKIAPEKFDKCGVLMAEERGAPWFGDDMVTPSAQWGVGLEGAIAMLEAEGGGDPQGEALAEAALNGAPDTSEPEQAPRIGAFPPFIPDDYKIEIVDNCVLDVYNPYTGETTECAQTDSNITEYCYDLYDRGNTEMISLTILAVILVMLGFE